MVFEVIPLFIFVQLGILVLEPSFGPLYLQMALPPDFRA